jgi:hypothetical protein
MSKHSRVWLALTAVLILALTGCASFKMRGSLQADQAVDRSFERFEFRQDMNYYSSGSDSYPNALMGLDKQYTLESDLWKKVESAATFKEMVQGMQKKTSEMNLVLHGFRILDNEGKAIGIWYAILEARAALVMKEDKRVLVYTPDLDLYIRREGGDKRED